DVRPAHRCPDAAGAALARNHAAPPADARPPAGTRRGGRRAGRHGRAGAMRDPGGIFTRRASVTPMTVLARAALAVALACSVAAEEMPGRRADGSILLPNGWALQPHGRQIQLDCDLPVRTAFDPGGHYLLVQHCGYRAHGITVVDAQTGKVVHEL